MSNDRSHAFEAERWVETVMPRWGYSEIVHVGGKTQGHPDHDYVALKNRARVYVEVKAARLSQKNARGAYSSRHRGAWKIRVGNAADLAAKEGHFLFILLIQDKPVAVFRADAGWALARVSKTAKGQFGGDGKWGTISVFEAEGMEMLWPIAST